ncbi:hypothetical protein DFR48_10743 [Ciceribacter lividus]|uniref:Uncharacterized protein n=1 Tax=Ciceribacter lividus TaxID=1197950 RepID=A0A6I7HLA3_9HYPH|nr:hypothetical protein [Ciceribacter lividus]RCW23174.1 hypothetical protein DFR48_10743 [Ciceribacter lividus]
MNTEFKFDDFGFDGNLAIVDPDGNYEWIEPQISSIPSEACIRLELVTDDGEGDDDARQALRDLLEEDYTVDIRCDFHDETDISRAVNEAVAIRDRFLAGDYTPLRAQCEREAANVET